ncbi:MAG: sigma 54-interacting transcriptional regulator [Deltaproteobacteria bacterium]|nr:sigma 54-interacting transcriptional regulator [Deltaproteobacteria bacterium]
MEKYEWWEQLDEGKRDVLLLAAMLPPPVSLDTLIALSRFRAVEILQFLDDLVSLNVLRNDASLGRGYYLFARERFVKFILAQNSPSDLQSKGKDLISYYEIAAESGQEQYLTLAHLYKISGASPPGFDYFLAAAVHYTSKEMSDEAISYYRIILDLAEHKIESQEQKKVYVKAAIGVTTAYGHMLSLPEQSAFLVHAQHFAEEIEDRELLLSILLVLGKTREVEGFYEKAAHHLDQAWLLAQESGNENLLKKAALMTSDFLFRQGRVDEAVKRYEEVIGDLEDFSSDAATLRGCATLGWCYGVCGQTSRGVGLIEAVRIKAEEHHMKEIKAFADLMMALTLLEARRVSEAEIYLNSILSRPEGVVGYSILWATHWCVAYVAYCHGDLEGCLREHIRGCELLKEYGRPHHRGGWVLEYLEGLETAGMGYPAVTLESELRRLITWPDIFMKGVAYRFRGQKSERASGHTESIRADFEMSLELLTRSGARLELARTQIVLARAFIREGDPKKAKKLLEEAWDAMSRSNAGLFPEDLKPYIEEKSHEDLLISTIVEIGNVLGTVREKKKLLELMIQLTMRFTFAERGGFFLLGEDGQLDLVASRNLDLAMVRSDRFRPYLKVIEKVARLEKETIKKTIGFQEPELPWNSQSNWMICSPVILQDRVLGVLYLASKVTRQYLKNDLLLLRAISTQVAVALDNASAYEKIASLKDRLEEETRYYRMDSEVSPQLDPMIGCSDAIRLVQNQMQKVAPMDSTVLIMGETGVGKELVARGIHRLSGRFSGPFIAANVASFSEGLIESELFGHEKGAFTGASKSRLGRFELAQGGTLFLDDIQNLSRDIQAKLLRILEEREFERVGGSKTLKADFRLLAAANRPLENMVNKKLFREDLYYRLNVFPIRVPPLKDRQEDIPALALHFLKMYNNNLGKEIRGISNRNMKRLMAYPWPGNVRELRHFIERAVILSEGNALILPSFQAYGREEGEPSKDLTLEEMERSYIIKILEKCAWKVGGGGGAAQLLGLKPTTLHSKIKRLGIQRKITAIKNP